MKYLITFLFLIQNQSFANIVCVDNNCHEVDSDSRVGSGLMDFDDDKKEKTPAVGVAKDEPGDDSYRGSGVKDHYSDLKYSDFQVGKCFIDKDNKVFYKVIERKEKDKRFTIVSEKENHNYILQASIVFFSMSEGNAYRKLQRWSCAQTANLNNSSYIKKCMGNGVRAGKKFCDTPRSY